MEHRHRHRADRRGYVVGGKVDGHARSWQLSTGGVPDGGHDHGTVPTSTTVSGPYVTAAGDGYLLFFDGNDLDPGEVRRYDNTGQLQWVSAGNYINPDAMVGVDGANRGYVTVNPTGPGVVERLTGSGGHDNAWSGWTGDYAFAMTHGAIQDVGAAQHLVVTGSLNGVPAVGRFTANIAGPP